MATNKITATNKDEVANKLHQIRDHMQTPDSFGRIILNDLLSNAVSKGTLTPDGAIEVSVKAKI
jgi:Tfp pilus assembly pilus retraction ATPase PilT